MTMPVVLFNKDIIRRNLKKKEFFQNLTLQSCDEIKNSDDGCKLSRSSFTSYSEGPPLFRTNKMIIHTIEDNF